MNILKGVMKEEYDRLIKLLKFYQNKIKQFPNGTISYKKRNKTEYVYLAFKKKNKVKFEYLGKKADKNVREIIKKIKIRKKYISLVRKIKLKIKKLKIILNGNKI